MVVGTSLVGAADVVRLLDGPAGAYVHPSTFRYRLRRVVEVGGLDLDDPETRFTAQLQLRVFDGLAREDTATGSPGSVRLGRR